MLTYGIDRSAVRCALPPELGAPAVEQPSSGGIVELPSFTDEETSRPTVQMPPLAEPHERPSIDDAFDRGFEDGPTAPTDPPRRSRRSRVSTLVGVAPGAGSRAPARPGAPPHEIS